MDLNLSVIHVFAIHQLHLSCFNLCLNTSQVQFFNGIMFFESRGCLLALCRKTVCFGVYWIWLKSTLFSISEKNW